MNKRKKELEKESKTSTEMQKVRIEERKIDRKKAALKKGDLFQPDMNWLLMI